MNYIRDAVLHVFGHFGDDDQELLYLAQLFPDKEHNDCSVEVKVVLEVKSVL